uniref:GGDEF domain-containing protein n=1 Tax=Magnetococcus massalia (strain MO-1) TaxID=451514 RepID=A0A1S7LMJ4_MAGMO|nr:Protein of unknown function. Containing a GGDEF domain [Candidatus Magnetococcus massalia]
MKDAIAELEEVLDHLRHDPPQNSQAISKVRDLIIKGPCDQQMAKVKQLLDQLLEQLVKPAVGHDQEQQAEVSRLQRTIAKQRDPDLDEIRTRLLEIIPWLDPSVHAQEDAATPSETLLPETFLPELWQALQLLSSCDPWLQEELSKHQQQPELATIHQLLTQLPEKLGEVEKRWALERKEMAVTIQNIAETLGENLSLLGESDQNASKIAETIRAADESVDFKLLKGMLLEEADHFVRHARRLHRQMEESTEQLVEAQRRLKAMDQALQETRDEQLLDPLTGLPNRFAFSAHLQKQLERSQALKRGCALIACQVDHLSQVLEGLTSQKRPRLITALANRMRRGLGGDDWLAHLSEERFMVLTEDVDQAVKRAEAMAQIYLGLPKELKAPNLRVRAAFAVLVLQPEQQEEEILAAIEQGVQEARKKEDGVRVVML